MNEVALIRDTISHYTSVLIVPCHFKFIAPASGAGPNFFPAAAPRLPYRWAEGRSDSATEFAAEFVRLKVDLIVTYANPIVLAAKQAASGVPIVFAAPSGPARHWPRCELARPGGNATGLSIENTDLVGKHLELLRDLIPGLRRLAIMVNVCNSASVLKCARFRQQHARSVSKSRH